MSTAYVLHQAGVQGRIASNESGAGDGVIARTAIVSLSANPTAGDNYALFNLPNGAVVTHASIRSTEIDTNATATFAAELGTLANGTDSASPHGLVAATVQPNGAGLNAQGGIDTSLAQLYYQATTTVVLTLTAVAATFAAGNVLVTVEYKTPGLTPS